MTKNLSWRYAIASCALSLLATTCAYAMPQGPCDPAPKNICCEEPKPGPFAFLYPKDMNLACPNDFYFYGDFLAMQPMQDGLVYGIVDTNASNVIGSSLSGGKVLSFSSDHNSYDWDYGARIGLGCVLSRDAWNLDVQWMWFHTNQDVNGTTERTGLIIPQWIPTQAPTLDDTDASQRWEMKLNVLDIALGKPFHVSRYVVLSPFFGLRAAWIDQNYVARYAGSFDTKFRVDRNNFWGVGTRMGVNSEWSMGSGFQLLANSSTSLLYSKFDVSENLPFETASYAFDSSFYRNSSNLELQVGVAWGTHFNDMQNYVRLQALWEFHTWYDQNQIRKLFSNNPAGTFVNDTVSRGDLNLSGISLRVMFDF
ncbi:MAG: Lpg1974 family pore-forming outer membrane protein [Chlamydiota bacterium]